MKTEEDEAFDNLAKKQGSWGGGFPAKQRMAADKLQEDLINYGTAWAQDGKRIDPASIYKGPAQEPDMQMGIAYQKGFHDGKQAALAQPAQEPSAMRPCRSCGGTGDRDTGIPESPIATCKPCNGTGQIALAQPAQEPTEWQTMEVNYPFWKELDIRMGDGSILCNVWPQSDGDLWWDGSGTGEKFIDPKYADVTHWRIHSDAIPPQPAQEQWLQVVTEKIEAALLSHRLSLHNDADDDGVGFPLVDALCCGQTSLEIGKREVKDIAEAIYHVLDANTPPAAQPPLPVQEPVAHFGSAYVNENGVHITTVLGPVAIPQDAKLYTTPPQRPWVGLIDTDIGSEFVRFQIKGGFIQFEYAVRAIEAKLKEKNNGT